MEGSIKIDKRTIRLSATAGALVRYKDQFGTDYIDDLQECQANNDNDRGVTVGYQLVWAMARTADSRTPSAEKFINYFKSDKDVVNAINYASGLYQQSMAGITNNDEGDGEKLTAENITALALCCGLNTADMDKMSMAMLLNTIDKYCKIKNGDEANEKPKRRMATQEDFDRF